MATKNNLKSAAVQSQKDMKGLNAKAKQDTATVVTQSDKATQPPVKAFKKPTTDYYRLDLVKRKTVAKQQGKGSKVMIEDIETNYREYLDSVRGTMSITGYIQALIDKDMKAKKK